MRHRVDLPAPPSWARRFGRATTWAVIGLWVVVIAATVPLAMKLHSVQKDGAIDYLPANAESTKVAKQAALLPGGETNDFIVVYHRAGALTPEDRSVAQQQLATLLQRYDVPLAPGEDASRRLIPSPDDTAVMYALPISVSFGQAEEVIGDLRNTVADHPAGVEVKVTGPAGVAADMDDVFSSIDATLLLATVAVVALLLILTYRSPVLWMVPLISVGCAAVLSMATVYLLVKAFDITVSTQSASILTVLVFGAGTDYALLLTARYREELRRRPGVRDAMAAALRGAGPAIVASAATVTAGLLCLLAADMSNIRGLGPVAAAGIACTLAVMMTLFPALLVAFGRKVFWPAVPRFGSEGRQAYGIWARLGQVIARRPVAAALVTLLALGALAIGLRGPLGDLREGDRFITKPESIVGFELLSERFPAFAGKPLTVLTKVDHKDEVLDAVKTTPGIVRAQPGRADDTWAEVTAFPKDPADSPAEQSTIERLRDRVHGIESADAMVGGASAEDLDQNATSVHDRNLVIPLVLGVVLVILILLLRAVIAPVLLIVTVVLSFGAAMGASMLIFEHLFGFKGLDATVPLLGFLFLVALGVDYNIFLVTRAQEEAARIGTRRGMLTALATTGGVITSAGVVLAATFAVLAMLPLVLMVEMGFLVAFGVLLDTFVVRSVLVPALTFSIDRGIWWPGRLSRHRAAHRAPRAPRRPRPAPSKAAPVPPESDHTQPLPAEPVPVRL
jgi:RND superfamily putative drug exporter